MVTRLKGSGAFGRAEAGSGTVWPDLSQFGGCPERAGAVPEARWRRVPRSGGPKARSGAVPAASVPEEPRRPSGGCRQIDSEEAKPSLNRPERVQMPQITSSPANLVGSESVWPAVRGHLAGGGAHHWQFASKTSMPLLKYNLQTAVVETSNYRFWEFPCRFGTPTTDFDDFRNSNY